MRPKYVCEQLEVLRHPFVVGIQERDPFSRCPSDAGVPRDRHHPGMGQREHLHALVPFCLLARPVG
jgi:hypothetical protein